MRYIPFAIAAVVSLQAQFALATPLERGANGLSEISVTMKNASETPIACGATLAHWYSQPIGTVQPGADLRATLWQNQQTGAVYLLNQLEDRMPVERLWCGVAGKSWETRSEITFERRAGVRVESIVMTCASQPLDFRCRQD